MNRMTALRVAACLALTLGGTTACSKQDQPKEQKSTPAASQATVATKEVAPHPPTTAKPGSHEDWCGEHQVPESMCTRCNPKLVAAFKATGDWCHEHGVPESQCKICNPNLVIERPHETADGAK